MLYDTALEAAWEEAHPGIPLDPACYDTLERLAELNLPFYIDLSFLAQLAADALLFAPESELSL